MTLSPLALEDVEALYLGPSFLMADPLGPLLDQDEDEALSPSSSLEGSPSFSPYRAMSSPPASLSPPPSPSPLPPPPSSFLVGTKAGVNSPPLAWLDAQVGANDGKDDAFVDMDWMSEKIDLSEFDLDSLIDSCSSADESPGSPEELLPSLDPHMDLDFATFDPAIPELALLLPGIPALPPEEEPPASEEAETTTLQEVVLKSEPPSPVPSPSPPSPAYTLDLGSEVDVPPPLAVIPEPGGGPLVLSVPAAAGQIVLLLANKSEPSLVPVSPPTSHTPPPLASDCDSDSGIESVSGSPTRLPSPPPPPTTAGSSRTKPYSKAEPAVTVAPPPRVKSVSGAPKVVEKKLKKMEQNKTAATRYRQKKRVEQEQRSSELEGLERRNRELSERAESISREIQYLKDLMEEVRKHHRGKSSAP